NPMTKEKDKTHQFQENSMPLGIPGHQHKERKDKIQHKVDIEQKAVLPTLHPFGKIDGFFRDMGIVDQHKLREPQVGPEDGESKYIFAHIMNMVLVDHLKVTPFLQEYGHQRHGRKTGNKPGGKKVPSKQR